MNPGLLVAEFAWDIVGLVVSIAALLLMVRLVPKQYRVFRLKVLPSIWGITTAILLWSAGPR